MAESDHRIACVFADEYFDIDAAGTISVSDRVIELGRGTG